MDRNAASILSGVLLMTWTGLAFAEASWSYSGTDGPEHWGQVSSDCDGHNQSPINLTGFVEANLEPIGFSYEAGGNEIAHKGNTVQVNFEPGSYITVNDTRFDLVQFHLHAPSENLIEGQSFPMELHFVHADKDGNLAVVGVMFEEGEANETLAAAWTHMPDTPGSARALSSAISGEGLLPVDRAYYRYNGSLTTPPCSEGVRWFVMKTPISASNAQIEAFVGAAGYPTNRPVQPVNARPVLR